MTPGVACSDGSLDVGEPLAGTSPYALSWVALEQNGPWGARAFTASHLDPAVGRAIEEVAAAHDVRPSLIRHPGRHADAPADHGGGRHVLVAHTRPGRSWLLEGTLARPEDLLGIDWPALREGDLDAVRRSLPTLEPSDDAHLLVCTNGRRDVCCAVKGRPVAAGVATRHRDRVWEVTHTSGHRFAPTAVLLPAGTLHGRLDVASAEELLAEAAKGRTVLEGSRGRSTWPAAAQAAELAVREEAGVLGLDELEVTDHRAAGEHAWTTGVRHVDGRSWRVHVQARESDAVRAESCGKGLKPMTWFAHATEESGTDRGPDALPDAAADSLRP